MKLKGSTEQDYGIIKYRKMEKRRNIFLTISLIVLLLIIVVVLLYKKFYTTPTLIVEDVFLEDNKVVVTFKSDQYTLKDNKVYCIYTTEDVAPKFNDKNWVLLDSNKCEHELTKDKFNIYLKNDNNKIIKVHDVDKIGYIDNLKINEENYYLALKEELKLEVKYDTYGYTDNTVTWTSSDNSIAKVVDGKVTGVKSGEVTISAKVMDKEVSSKIIVTNLLTVRPKSFDFKKKNLSCDIYSKKDNDLIDSILEFKVKKVGYKTRASAVEAARFLTLDFPYRINYFYENGRLKTNKTDGKGRYYHKGLYLDESRYDSISHSRKGPKTWGCMLYSVPDEKKSPNGFDCSGFVSWVLLNGGFDPGDIGAGITSIKDLTDLGDTKKLTKKIATSDSIKVGDLLHNNMLGGHIGIIVGIDNNNYYVAQAVWFDEVGVIISKYKKDELQDMYNEVVYMDKYYKKDGLLTNMW